MTGDAVSGPQALILASSSRYRRELLQRLRLEFSQLAPEIDESRLPDEAPALLAARLARQKAEAIVALRPDALVIGSDQVAARGETLLGKPGDHLRAQAQLAACSGNCVQFHTALCVIDGRSGRVEQAIDLTEVVFRELNAHEIDAYLRAEQPYDCAGSFKAEGLGITLFERVQTGDPTALIGLPLIALSDLLRNLGRTLL